MRRSILALPFIALFSMPSNATLTLESYLKFKASPEPQIKNVLMTYLGGVNGAMLVMNESFFIRTRIHMYCQPEKLALNAEQLATMIDTYLRDYPQSDKDTPIEFVALNALQYTFPCKNTSNN